MNIFVLHEDPIKAAEAHYDTHVIKMILESAQILCTVHHLLGGTAPYKPTHKNHPCTVWARQSLHNYLWLSYLAFGLNEEYKRRFNHTEDHKSFTVIKNLPMPVLPIIGLTDFAMAMPMEFVKDNAIESYRDYYAYGKSHLLKYTNTDKPDWLVARSSK